MLSGHERPRATLPLLPFVSTTSAGTAGERTGSRVQACLRWSCGRPLLKGGLENAAEVGRRGAYDNLLPRRYPDHIPIEDPFRAALQIPVDRDGFMQGESQFRRVSCLCPDIDRAGAVREREAALIQLRDLPLDGGD